MKEDRETNLFGQSECCQSLAGGQDDVLLGYVVLDGVQGVQGDQGLQHPAMVRRGAEQVTQAAHGLHHLCHHRRTQATLPHTEDIDQGLGIIRGMYDKRFP